MPLSLPPEFRFDVEKAVRELSALAESEPKAPIALTLATLGDDGLESESEVYVDAAGAAAILVGVSEDQSFSAGGRRLVLLRITRNRNDFKKQLQDEYSQVTPYGENE